jgi:hypothetical protein
VDTRDKPGHDGERETERFALHVLNLTSSSCRRP